MHKSLLSDTLLVGYGNQNFILHAARCTSLASLASLLQIPRNLILDLSKSDYDID